MRRLLGVVAVALILAAGSVPASPVAALDQSAATIRVTENQTVEKDFGPIPGQKPVSIPAPAPPLDAPDDCKQAAYCDVVPLEVVVPATLAPADEFFVSVELIWDTAKIPSTPAKPTTTAVNDMDFSVWDSPQGEEALRTAATDQEPESLKLYRPSKGKYQIVVVNFAGPNTGYKLKVTYKPEIIVPPFESLEPSFTAPVTEATEPAPPPPVDLSDGPEPPAAPAPAVSVPEPVAPVAAPATPPPPAPNLEPVPVEPDADFAKFSDSDFDQALAAPPSQDVLVERRARSAGPAEPASPGALLFWLAFVPLAVVLAGGVWLAQRGSAVLRFK